MGKVGAKGLSLMNFLVSVSWSLGQSVKRGSLLREVSQHPLVKVPNKS